MFFNLKKIIQNFIKFLDCQKKNKEIVFYSEGSHDSIYFEGIIDILSRKFDKDLIILTSEEDDIIFNLKSNNIKVFYIGSGFIRTIIFFLIKSEIFIMSLPDLENYYLKRSRVYNTKYIYIFHSVSSTNAAYNKKAFDNYDYIFCRGQHQINEIIENENFNDLRKKTLVQHGCPIFDKIGKDFNKEIKNPSRILIAPSWNKKKELIDLDFDKIIQDLLSMKFQVTVRLHPMTVRRKLEKINKLKKKFSNIDNFRFSQNMENKNDLYEHDILITDWSGISWEFSLMLGKPTLFVNTPKKIMNSDYDKFLNKAVEIDLRNKIGFVCDIDNIKETINKFKTNEFINEFNDSKVINILNYRKKMFFNPGRSSEVGAQKIIDILEKKL